MASFAAGAAAGLAVDLSLYPIDTVKTRIQSKRGFLASGGFRGIYRGLSTVAVGSIPGGAFFFAGYDGAKGFLTSLCLDHNNRRMAEAGETGRTPAMSTGQRMGVQVASAVVGETAACSIRVPVEMVKQRMQAGHYTSVVAAVRGVTSVEGPCSGRAAARAERWTVWGCQPGRLFVGMPVTLAREIPFAMLQMTFYEALKRRMDVDSPMRAASGDSTSSGGEHASRLSESVRLALCGSVAGGTAAFLTTPLDVAKTRIMLGESAHPNSILRTLLDIARGVESERAVGSALAPLPPLTSTLPRLFSGATTRVVWISIGGAVFFTTYESVKRILQ